MLAHVTALRQPSILLGLIPADQLCDGRRAVSLAHQRRRPVRECSALLMQHRCAAANANNRRIPRRAVRLFSRFDRCHANF